MLPAGDTTSRGADVAVLIGEGFTPMNSGGEAVGELRLTGLSKGVRVAVNPFSLTTSDNICHIKCNVYITTYDRTTSLNI